MTFRRAPPQVEPRERVAAAPSLISQAAAHVAIQALIRSDRAPGRGVRAAGARQVSPPAPALPSPPFAASQPPPPHPRPRPRVPAAGLATRPVQAPDEDLRLRAGASPATPAAPARPQDVQRLGLAGGPGGREGRARGLLPSLRHRLLLGAGPPAAAPRAPRVSRAPAPPSAPCPSPPPPQTASLLSLWICSGYPELSTPVFHSMAHSESQEACSVFSRRNAYPPQPQSLPPIKCPLSPAYLSCPSFILGEGLGGHTPPFLEPTQVQGPCPENCLLSPCGSCLPRAQPFPSRSAGAEEIRGVQRGPPVPSAAPWASVLHPTLGRARAEGVHSLRVVVVPLGGQPARCRTSGSPGWAAASGGTGRRGRESWASGLRPSGAGGRPKEVGGPSPGPLSAWR